MLKVANTRRRNRECEVDMSVDDRGGSAVHDGLDGGRVRPTENVESSSGGATFVVMQTADVWNWDDRAAG